MVVVVVASFSKHNTMGFPVHGPMPSTLGSAMDQVSEQLAQPSSPMIGHPSRRLWLEVCIIPHTAAVTSNEIVLECALVIVVACTRLVISIFEVQGFCHTRI
jgi:hypothetical protein